MRDISRDQIHSDASGIDLAQRCRLGACDQEIAIIGNINRIDIARRIQAESTTRLINRIPIIGGRVLDRNSIEFERGIGIDCPALKIRRNSIGASSIRQAEVAKDGWREHLEQT